MSYQEHGRRSGAREQDHLKNNMLSLCRGAVADRQHLEVVQDTQLLLHPRYTETSQQQTQKNLHVHCGFVSDLTSL